MSKHSRAPWTVTPDSFVMSGTRPSIGVARIITHAAEFEANARLISAAPELLEAAVGMVRSSKESTDPNDWVAACDQLETAIAKAEGRS